MRGALISPSTGHAVVAGLLALVMYSLTMPRTITLEDAGLFQMVCHLGGLSHPPGYPLFTLLCSALTVTPSVVNGNLISALFAALAVATFHHVCFVLMRDRAFAYVASLTWALGATFWSQAIIIEVYSLAALMFMVCWALLIEFERTRNTGWWFAFCLAYGLSLSNHWPLMVLSTVGLVVGGSSVIADLWVRLRSVKFIGLSLLAVGFGLLPYLSLLDPTPDIAVFGGIDSWSELWRYVARSAYNDQSPTAGAGDKLAYAGWLIETTVWQGGLAVIPLIVVGFISSFMTLPRKLALALLLIFTGSTFFLVLLLNFEWSDYYRAVFKPYPVIAFSAVAFWLALGTRSLVNLVQPYVSRAGLLISVVVIAVTTAANFPLVDRRGSRLVDNFARTLLQTLPADAILFTRGDNSTGPIGYLHYVEGIRPDIELRDLDNLVFSNRLASPFAAVALQDAMVKDFIDRQSRPVFVVEGIVNPHIDYGAYLQVSRTGQNRYEFLPEFDAFVDLLVEIYQQQLTHDHHERYFVFQQLVRFSKQYIGYAVDNAHHLMPERIQSRVQLLQSTFPGKLITLEKLVPAGAEGEQRARLLRLAEAAELQMSDSVTLDARAVFYELVGRIHQFAPQDLIQAERYLNMSISARPVSANTSICPLLTVYRQLGKEAEADDLRVRFGTLSCDAHLPSGS
jgi:hypothetical protein